MRYILYTSLLFTAITSTTAKAQSIDSLLRKLPSSADYFSPKSITDPKLIESDSSHAELVSYLKEGVGTALPPLRSTLSINLSLPWVVRPLKALPELRIDTPKQADKDPFNFTQQILAPYQVKQSVEHGLWQYLQSKHIDHFSYTQQALLADKESRAISTIQQNALRTLASNTPSKSIQDYADQFQVSEIERKYWIPGFESSIQFTQNYLSDNWHKGGTSNLNLQMRNYFSMYYNKDRVSWLNELESKLGLYRTGIEPQKNRYRVNEDLLRLRSNYGIKFNKHWSYTVDAELRTQLFNIYNADNTILQSAPFAPLRTNIGIGLQYNYKKKSKRRYGSNFALSFNLAPFSHNWRWSHRADIALNRHGLSTDKMSLHTFGSTMRGQMVWNINMDVSWVSRAYFNTSYKNIEAEWENTLVLRISRYFSTRINIHLRFDDSEAPSPKWNKHLQINELLSFGFNYKL